MSEPVNYMPISYLNDQVINLPGNNWIGDLDQAGITSRIQFNLTGCLFMYFYISKFSIFSIYLYIFYDLLS